MHGFVDLLALLLVTLLLKIVFVSFLGGVCGLNALLVVYTSGDFIVLCFVVTW